MKMAHEAVGPRLTREEHHAIEQIGTQYGSNQQATEQEESPSLPGCKLENVNVFRRHVTLFTGPLTLGHGFLIPLLSSPTDSPSRSYPSTPGSLDEDLPATE
jgi:hypothetical protein